MKKSEQTWFYILFSPSLNKYYTGITTESTEARLSKHNSSYYGTHYTSKASDWQIKLTIACDSFSEARRMELYVKKMKSSKFIEKIIADDAEQQKLIQTIRSI